MIYRYSSNHVNIDYGSMLYAILYWEGEEEQLKDFCYLSHRPETQVFFFDNVLHSRHMKSLFHWYYFLLISQATASSKWSYFEL